MEVEGRKNRKVGIGSEKKKSSRNCQGQKEQERSRIEGRKGKLQ